MKTSDLGSSSLSSVADDVVADDDDDVNSCLTFGTCKLCAVLFTGRPKAPILCSGVLSGVLNNNTWMFKVKKMRKWKFSQKGNQQKSVNC